MSLWNWKCQQTVFLWSLHEPFLGFCQGIHPWAQQAGYEGSGLPGVDRSVASPVHYWSCSQQFKHVMFAALLVGSAESPGWEHWSLNMPGNEAYSLYSLTGLAACQGFWGIWAAVQIWWDWAFQYLHSRQSLLMLWNRTLSQRFDLKKERGRETNFQWSWFEIQLLKCSM